MNAIHPEACVHGRFQPPHNGHLEYILAAKQHCEFLWIGITSYDIRKLYLMDAAPHRARRAANPLTYFERVQIITEMLLDIGIARGEFACTPFPIEQPEELPAFLSTNIPCFTTVYDEWSRQKIARLEQQGYTNIILYERQTKAIEGMRIRESVRLRCSDWENLVPSATVRAIHRLNLAERLINLATGDLNGR